MERTITNPIPSPPFPGGEEPVEQAFLHFRANACAMIANAQPHFVVAIASRALTPSEKKALQIN
jgi:hypothetical protein